MLLKILRLLKDYLVYFVPVNRRIAMFGQQEFLLVP
jgi:hypothetical protein